MDWIQSNCKTVSIAQSAGAYAGVGASGSIELSGQKCDCCNSDTGETIEEDYFNVTGRASAKIGIGGGGHFRAFGYYISPGELLGPQVELLDTSVGYEKPCGEEGYAFFTQQVAIDVSGSYGIGAGAGASVSAGLKGWANIQVKFYSKKYESSVNWGYTASAKLTVHLGLGSISQTWTGPSSTHSAPLVSGSF